MQVHNFIQGSPEWFAARAGMPTASEFQAVMAGKDAASRTARRTYMLKLVGERLTRKPRPAFSGRHTRRGHAMEAEARDLYAFLKGVTPVQVGFITNKGAGCSPDSLIGVNGALEIKTKEPHLLLDAYLNPLFPAEHKAQCQGQLFVAEREWVDLAIYWPDMPLVTQKAYRDEPYLKALERELAVFNAELEMLVDRLRARGHLAEKVAA